MDSLIEENAIAVIDTADSLVPAASHPPQEVKSSWLQVFLFRLFLLGIGGTLAALIGFFLAFVYPSANPTQPLAVKVWNHFKGENLELSASENASLITELNPQTRQQLETEIKQLQREYAQLSDRLSQLELELGISRPNQSLKSRLDRLEQQLSPENLARVNSSPNPSQIPSEQLKVTLPSNILFNEKNTTLQEEAETLLEEFVTDLKDYSGATILIAAHTDLSDEAAVNRELSFYRARTIQQYLSQSLGEDYHWVIVGYGKTRPLISQEANLDPQLNNRVEITVK